MCQKETKKICTILEYCASYCKVVYETIFRVFREWSKVRKYPQSSFSPGDKNLVDVKGQRQMPRLLQAEVES